MATTTVSQFALELKMPASALLEQLNKAGVEKTDGREVLTDQDKAKLLDYFRSSRSGSQKKLQVVVSRSHAGRESKTRVIVRRKVPVDAPISSNSIIKDLGLTQEQAAFLQRLGVPLDC